MIPLLMEQMSWPPSGSMGSIFGEFIYVKFFQNAGVSSADQRYWPVEKFTELLLQLRYYIAPQSDAIPDDSPYFKWWKPDAALETVLPEIKSIQAKSLPPVEIVENPASNVTISALPEVFISYQWDKQEEIKRLYSCLTGHGFKCWLDILQMGGGDGLYEKIDHGIRNCRVLVSCVTNKYAKSANCRREIGLSDALEKPIVPILLENISWPPEGPMGPVMSQMIYIDFFSENSKKNWSTTQYNQLLEKLCSYTTPNLNLVMTPNQSDKMAPSAAKQNSAKSTAASLNKRIDQSEKVAGSNSKTAAATRYYSAKQAAPSQINQSDKNAAQKSKSTVAAAANRKSQAWFLTSRPSAINQIAIKHQTQQQSKTPANDKSTKK